MKKIILASLFIIASIGQFSCTNDGVETTPNNNKINIAADGGTGQIPVPIPPPKP